MSADRNFLWSFLPEWCHEYIGDALTGDIEAAGRLVFAAPNEKRPEVVQQLENTLGAGHPAVRATLAEVWMHDHGHLIAEMGLRRAWQLLKHNGTRPEGLPKTVTVWRGGIGSPRIIRDGWSWTTDKRVACFFLQYWEHRVRSPFGPCVVKAEVPTSRIVHATNDRGEFEVVLFGAKNAVVDGDPEEWNRLAADLVQSRKMAGPA